MTDAYGPSHGSSRSDVVVAIRNTFRLAGSLLLTWGIGLAARILLPRYLGPDAFGALNFADAFTGTAFVVLTLGIDTYVRKEVSVRREHAEELFGGTLALRLALTLVLFVVMGIVLNATGRPPEVRRLVYAFGGAQLFQTLNGTFAAMLHARGSVSRLAFVNIVSKLLWGAGIVAGVVAGEPLLAVPVSLLVTEAGKAAVLWRLTRRELALRLRVDVRATRVALIASLPFYLDLVANTASSRIDVSVLEFLANDRREVGWYGAASTLARLGLLLTPLLSWVLMPLLSRAAARSEAELRNAIARSMEVVLVLMVPVSLMLSLGADVWVGLLFGPAFAPAVTGLRLLGPVFVLTYVATVTATCLNLQGRGWTATGASIAGTILNAALNAVLIPGAARLGTPGAAGSAAAAAALAAEAFVVGVLTWRLRGHAFDRRGADVALRTGAVCLLVMAVDRLATPLGPARVAVDVAAYVAAAVALRAVPWREIAALVRSALGRRSAPTPGLDPGAT